MSDIKMHDNEVDIDEPLVRQLLSEQFPQWAQLTIKPIKSAGTDNAIYRLGTDMCIRLPRTPGIDKHIQTEQKWLPIFSPLLPLEIPVPLAQGNPNENYPYHWSICRWLEGENAFITPIVDLHQAALELAQFLIALQQIDTTDAPRSRRGGSLALEDTATRRAIESLHDIIDTDAAQTLWTESLQAPEWNKRPVWTHGDLLPTNILVEHGKLSGVIDFDLAGAGDPACDLIVAWSVLSSDTRDVFRTMLAVDDATWLRGRGRALSIALTIIPYYKNTNPVLIAVARRMVNEILTD